MHAVCAYRVSNLIGEFKKLAWASKLKVITVFRTDQYSHEKGLATGPIAELSGGSSYPFTALADPDGSAASVFQIGSRASLLQFVDNYRILPKVMRSPDALMEGLFNAKGASSLLPSEFLIDENGILVDVLRAKRASEHLKMDRIKSFLLVGKYNPTQSISSTRKMFE